MEKLRFHTIIKDLGLTENEAAVYLAALSLGPTTVLSIAKASGLERANIYRVIESLQKRGLMSTTLDGIKSKYEVASPDRLEQLADTRRQKLQDALPELRAMYNQKAGISDVKFYRGIDGIKTAYEGMFEKLKPSDFYYVVSNLDDWYPLDAAYLESFVQKRIKRNIKLKMLLQDGEKAEYNKKFEKNFMQEVKILPEGTVLETDTIITPHEVVVVQFNEPITTFVIENPSLISSYKQYFDIMWGQNVE